MWVSFYSNVCAPSVIAEFIWKQDSRLWHHHHQRTILWYWHRTVWQQASPHLRGWDQHVHFWYVHQWRLDSDHSSYENSWSLTVFLLVFLGFGANTAGGSLFGNKPATGGLGAGLGTNFGAGSKLNYYVDTKYELLGKCYISK